MPKKAAELGALQVSRLAKPGAHAVGGVAGLQLRINPDGARSWVLRAMVNGKRRDMGLGGFPDVTLAQAKQLARDARALIQTGVDPIQARREARSAVAAATAKAKTFDQCAAAYIKAKSGEWANAKHHTQWETTLERFASPFIGDLLVADVDVSNVLQVLEPIWTTKTETASRLRGRLESILELTKDNEGRYIIELDVTDGNGRTILWRTPVVVTDAIAQGTFLIGDFTRAARLYDRQQANVEVATEHADFFCAQPASRACRRACRPDRATAGPACHWHLQSTGEPPAGHAWPAAAGPVIACDAPRRALPGITR